MPQHSLATVIIPTTGGLIRIAGVKPRPRLKSSYVAITGDFRPLRISPDYNRFVSGPLTNAGLAEGPHELALTGDIDSGRSWELPTLIAHLLATSNRLAQLASPQALPEPEDAAGRFIWATGMVDPELSAQPGDYAIPEKCDVSRGLFEALAEAGRALELIVPASLPEDHRERLASEAARYGFTLSEVASLADVRRVLGLSAAASPPAALAAEPVVAAGQVGAPAPHVGDQQAPVRPLSVVDRLKQPIVLAIIFSFVLVGILAVALTRSRPSNDVASAISVIRLEAADRMDCIARIMESRPLDQKPVVRRDGVFAVLADTRLCGFRFVNLLGEPLRIGLTSEFAGYVIRGDNPIFRGTELAVDGSIELIFARPPTPGSATMTLEDGSARRLRWQVSIKPPQASSSGGSEE